MRHQADVMEEMARCCVEHTMTQAKRALIVDLATVISHITFVMIGHSQHLTKI